VSLRRGFKAEAERISADVREEMNLSLHERLDPICLARHLCLPVMNLREAARHLGDPELATYFLTEDTDSFSALTLFYGMRRVIIHNESHAPTRQASNIAHEISHCLLEHPPEPVLDLDGHRRWNEQLEMEATWLGGTLLMPRAGALRIARSGLPVDQIARHFGVSEPLCRWRLNETGVASQLQRYANFRTMSRKAG
jgi:Zn-dependent peptidase ImmA (M78 family)